MGLITSFPFCLGYLPFPQRSPIPSLSSVFYARAPFFFSPFARKTSVASRRPESNIPRKKIVTRSLPPERGALFWKIEKISSRARSFHAACNSTSELNRCSLGKISSYVAEDTLKGGHAPRTRKEEEAKSEKRKSGVGSQFSAKFTTA